MTATQIPPGQWIARLRDILTGNVLKTFQDMSEYCKSSYNTVCDKLLASKNLMAEHYRLQVGKAGPSSEQSFSDYISSLNTTLNCHMYLHVIA